MILKKNDTIITVIVAAVFATLLIWWIADDHYPSEIIARIPGMDNRPKIEPRADSVIIGEFFDTLNNFDELVPGNWPRFRGTYFDNICHDTISMAESWDSAGPPLVWKVTLGEGYAGPAVFNGRVYVMDYNERRKADMLRCFSLKSGTELWRRWYYVDIKRNHGYSRTIPAVTEKYLVSIGPRSHVMCLDPLTGDLRWTIDMEKEYGIPGKSKGRITPDFYSGQCPLIDNDVAVLAPGGKALMIGVDCETGKILWKTPNPDTLRMSHCSIMPMILHGRKMYVYNAVGGVCGVSAEGEDIGKLLWQTTKWSPATVAASPLLLENNEIAVFGSYGAGGARIKINFNGSEYSASVIESHKAMEGISSDQQTPVILGDHIWSIMPENAGPLKKQLVCYHKSDLRLTVWTSGKDNRYGRGLGPYIVKGDKMFLLDDDANLYFFKIDGPSATLLSRYKPIDGIEAWGPMAIAGNFLIMRDARNLLCLFIGKNS
ncbi:MAG TPA: PQQ-binding-like beta-propeller repeat protein [Bacteroidales bacterium]|nr:PQQ-binding-like beta-propeller repeat protein [Bacteroidales bacterium]HOX73538.1 PQQ-binding-like beta-propeller repeat protein [Bacteroidales bacterium]HQM67908.1 PQQ-binding-like beta-propeller repeat protein [Bacteroidales bacterium]